MSQESKVAPVTATRKPGMRRLAPEQREQQIVEKAIQHFTRHGFSGSTRELAREIGVTQPLLYRYFPSKDALIDRVYKEVFNLRPTWKSDLTNRQIELSERLYRFYCDYAQVILREEWIRIFIFAGLTREGINDKYLHQLRAEVFLPVLAEMRHEYGVAEPKNDAELEQEIELVWALHASIFYVGVRKWIYGLDIPDDINGLIRTKITAFLEGAPKVMSEVRRDAGHDVVPSENNSS